MNNSELSYEDFSSIRRSNWNVKASNPKLIQMELLCHQITCQEYSVDILKHLIQLENQSRPSLDSFQTQPEINGKMRALIFDFIMCCHKRLNLSSSTLFLCFSIIDRYSSKIIVKPSTYQLLALCSIWIASKFNDTKPKVPNLEILIGFCCNQYTKKQFKEMELHLLKSLNWSACLSPTYDFFIDILLKNKITKLNYRNLNLNDIKCGSIMLCELCCFDETLNFNYNASAIALASVTLITCALRYELLKEFDDYQSKVHDSSLLEICQLILKNFFSNYFPSSFKLKYYLNNLDDKLNQPIPGPILKSLINYTNELNQYFNLNLESMTPLPSDLDTHTSNSIQMSSVGFQNRFKSSVSLHIPPTPTTPGTNISVKRTLPTIRSPPASEFESPIDLSKDIPVSSTASNILTNIHIKRKPSNLDLDFFQPTNVLTKRIR